MATAFDVGIHFVNILILFVLIVVGLGLTVLIFVILLKASKLLSLMIDKAKKDSRQPPLG
jgi:hypothetical protein